MYCRCLLVHVQKLYIVQCTIYNFFIRAIVCTLQNKTTLRCEFGDLGTR
jgi:hypothetical protein